MNRIKFLLRATCLCALVLAAPMAFVAAWAREVAQTLPVRSRSHPKTIETNTVLSGKTTSPAMGWPGKL